MARLATRAESVFVDVVTCPTPEFVPRHLLAAAGIQMLDMAGGFEIRPYGFIRDEVRDEVRQTIAGTILSKGATRTFDARLAHKMALPADIIAAFRIQTGRHGHLCS